MLKKEDQGYRNPAYIYDEGQSGGGPDTRSSASASSSSSKSSMKAIGSKLKGQGRRRYICLALVIFIVIAIIVAVTTTLVLKNQQNDNKSGSTTESSSIESLDVPISTMSSVTTPTSPDTTHARQTTTSTTAKPTTRQKTATTTTIPTTIKRSTTTEATTAAAKTTRKTTKKTTTKPTTTPSTEPTTPARKKTVDTSTAIAATTTKKITTTTQKPASQATLTNGTKAPTTNSTTQSTTNATTTTETSVTNGNLTVSMSSILYYPGDVKTVTLRCNGQHQGDWKTMTIRRQFDDSFEPVAVAVLNDNNELEVFKFYPNVTHTINTSEFEVTFALTFDPFLCTELTNFTCAFANEFGTVTGKADISIYMPPPKITLPHSIVEDSELALNCVAEVWGSSASLSWQFKPEYSSNFMEFSVEPLTNITSHNCSREINSTLVFNPTMYEDGAVFRCEIVDTFVHPQLIQTQADEVTFKVVPSNYCEGKRQFTIHPHPHGPCTLVVYCINTGPLVYEIECEPGQCYDYVKTACVAS